MGISLRGYVEAKYRPIEAFAIMEVLDASLLPHLQIQGHDVQFPPDSSDMDWLSRGICRRYDPNLWYPESENEPETEPEIDVEIAQSVEALAARTLCERCVVRQNCEEYIKGIEKGAKEEGDRHGIWGGLDPHERQLAAKAVKAAARRRNRGRLAASQVNG